MITKADVDHIALLARLDLSEDERDLYASQLSEILENFQTLERLDTEGVEPTAHVLPLHNVYREDWVGQHLSRQEVLSNGPDVEENCFKVPKIV